MEWEKSKRTVKEVGTGLACTCGKDMDFRVRNLNAIGERSRRRSQPPLKKLKEACEKFL